jgi:epoxyqueuosine reductase QueG
MHYLIKSNQNKNFNKCLLFLEMSEANRLDICLDICPWTRAPRSFPPKGGKKIQKGGNLRPKRGQKRGHLEKQHFIQKSNDILQIQILLVAFHKF